MPVEQGWNSPGYQNYYPPPPPAVPEYDQEAEMAARWRAQAARWQAQDAANAAAEAAARDAWRNREPASPFVRQPADGQATPPTLPSTWNRPPAGRPAGAGVAGAGANYTGGAVVPRLASGPGVPEADLGPLPPRTAPVSAGVPVPGYGGVARAETPFWNSPLYGSPWMSTWRYPPIPAAAAPTFATARTAPTVGSLPAAQEPTTQTPAATQPATGAPTSGPTTAGSVAAQSGGKAAQDGWPDAQGPVAGEEKWWRDFTYAHRDDAHPNGQTPAEFYHGNVAQARADRDWGAKFAIFNPTALEWDGEKRVLPKDVWETRAWLARQMGMWEGDMGFGPRVEDVETYRQNSGRWWQPWNGQAGGGGGTQPGRPTANPTIPRWSTNYW